MSKNAPLRKLEINLAIIPQLPAFKVFLLLKFNQFLSKFLGSLLLVFFFHLVFVISVHYDQAQVVLVFVTKPPPSSHKPVEELRNPFSSLNYLIKVK